MIAALKPPKRQRPLIAIIGINDATETTDYLMPYGILRRADVADVVALATEPGPVTLYPALKVEPQATVADFDARHPEGADYVIVPAMSRDDDPAVLQWIKSQAAKGAIVIGVCAGAKVVGQAGLLDGKRATTHWYYLKELRDKHPAIHYVADRRLVVDRGVATTTGITASMPMSLTLIEAIAGRDKAEAVGRDLGFTDWDARHDSDAFKFTRPFALDGDRQHARLLEPRAARHRACARHRRSVARPRRGCLVADLSVTRGDVRRYRRCAADPQRHPHFPRSGRHELARGAAASGDRGAATGGGIGRGPSRNRGPLRNAHSRLRRHAARIPNATRAAIRVSEWISRLSTNGSAENQCRKIITWHTNPCPSRQCRQQSIELTEQSSAYPISVVPGSLRHGGFYETG